MSTIKSSAEDLTINADGSNEIKFQINAVEKASINSSGLLTSTTIDATVLTGNLPAISGASLTGISGGKVLQVVFGSTVTGVQSTSSTYADVGLSAAITPAATTSKVLVIVTINGLGKHTADTGMGLRLVRGVTTISVISQFLGRGWGTGYYYLGNASTSYLDSPSTTSATTYKATYNNTTGTGTVQIGYGTNPMSTITLIEIGA